jgi:amino acid adenylation domain-containing protein
MSHASVAASEVPEYFVLPASFAQERLWFIDQMDPGGAAYNVPFVARIEGPLDADALAVAFDDAATRHEVLRSVLATQDGVVVQVVPVDAVPLARVVDAAGWDDASAQAAAAAEARAPFALASGPLVRVTIWRQSANRHWLAVVAHHAMLDGFSLALLLEEVSASMRGTAAAPPEVQYADFAEWQREWMTDDTVERELAWWTARLSSPITPLNLPTDRPRPAEQDLAGDLLVHRFASATTDAVRALAKREGVSAYVLLHASVAALLSRLTGTTDVLLGTPIATRPREELARAIGMLVNTVTLRTQITAEEPFRQLLQRVKAETLETMEHADVPFERVVKAVAPPRDASVHPMFQAMFSYQPAPGSALALAGCAIHDVPMGNGTSRFDLWIDVQDTPATGLTAFVEYATACFDRASVQHWMDALEMLLTAAAEAPETPVGVLPLLSPRHAATVLDHWAGPADAAAADAPSATQWVVASLGRRAQETVIADADGERSAASLLDDSARIAAALAARGVVAGDVVGVAMSRSADVMAALLGVWRAGAAYLPLDPAHPADRLAYVAGDAGARVILVDAVGSDALDGLDLPLLGMGAARAAMPAVADAQVTPDALAYVIYTSGSTGRPKGVEIAHGALVNFLVAFAGLLPDGATARTLAATTVSFDIAGLELWLPLVTGGSIIMASEDDQHEPERLAARIAGAQCTLVQATPTVWRALIEAGFSGGAHMVALVGGEPVPLELAHRLATTCRQAWNVYGPTETTIWSTTARIGANDTAVSIGRPIRRTQAYVVSAAGHPLPPGFMGELVLAGAGVARGYHHRPELTAERFVSLPFANDARGYRTGDHARWHHDGTLRCLGRADDQVKVRGHRIELGEIERVLLDASGVADAAVAVRSGPRGDPLLAAYYVPSPGAALTGSQLRRHLRDHLPEYMVPSAFTEVRELPRTANGKTDRRALPDPFATQVSSAREAPATATETTIAGIWREILGVSEVGRHDTFFDLGGHSLLGVRMLVAVERALGVALPKPVPLFRTLEQLARACDDRRAAAS